MTPSIKLFSEQKMVFDMGYALQHGGLSFLNSPRFSDIENPMQSCVASGHRALWAISGWARAHDTNPCILWANERFNYNPESENLNRGVLKPDNGSLRPSKTRHAMSL
jgi:hypothetical protein